MKRLDTQFNEPTIKKYNKSIQPIKSISIKRKYFVYYNYGCTSICSPLSYPLGSLLIFGKHTNTYLYTEVMDIEYMWIY
jgi:hypothetical protein